MIGESLLMNPGEAMEDYFTLRLTEDEIRAISSIGLAHLGDAVDRKSVV